MIFRFILNFRERSQIILSLTKGLLFFSTILFYSHCLTAENINSIDFSISLTASKPSGSNFFFEEYESAFFKSAGRDSLAVWPSFKTIFPLDIVDFWVGISANFVTIENKKPDKNGYLHINQDSFYEIISFGISSNSSNKFYSKLKMFLEVGIIYSPKNDVVLKAKNIEIKKTLNELTSTFGMTGAVHFGLLANIGLTFTISKHFSSSLFFNLSPDFTGVYLGINMDLKRGKS